jgi:outer membrane receptor protein involved in Fe transport
MLTSIAARTGGDNDAGRQWVEQMGGVRFVVAASIAAGVAVGHKAAYAQSGPDRVETLPPVEVTAPGNATKRGRSTEAKRVVRTRPTVYVPTAPAPTATSASAIEADKVPASVNIVDTTQIERTNSPSITDALLQSVPSISINEVAGNPFQPDVQFRGYVASPVSGTPQGLAVYQNGVRINEAFGDIVNWDLIPTAAIKSVTLVTNNPAFGLNALGGAIDIQMKDGFNYHGTELSVMGGSFGRIQGSAQWGKQIDNNYAVYGALEGAHDDGYRNFSESDIRRFYGDVAYKNDVSEFHLNMGAADNTFGATGTVPAELLQQYWGATYTTPQTSHNQVGYFNLTGKVEATPSWTIEGSAHLRFYKQDTQDGNPTGTQPCADPTLLCFGDNTTPAYGLNGVQLSNPFPSSAVLGENDRTSTQSTTAGLSLQATNDDKLIGHANHFTVGASLDTSVTWFNASAELGTFGPNYVLNGSGIFLGPSGSPVTDGPVSLRTTNQYIGVYALDTFDITDRFSISGGGRFNTANITLEDQLGTSLNGTHEYDRFNPMIGGTYKITPELTFYAGYSEANRAPTPLELGCADPANPCTIATFLVSDPDLKQVVSHTIEAGFRGTKELNIGTLSWKLGGFRATNTDDILAIADPVLQGFGYFQNVGDTRRQGIEAEINLKSRALQVYASYSFVDARFLDSLTLGSNSPFADANGNIQVSPGDQIPEVPRHRVKAGFDYNVTDAFKVGGDGLWVSSQYYVGDESNQFPKLPGYAVFNAHASYQINKTYQVFGRIDNIFDNRYSTYGTFFETDALPNFANGGAAFTDPRSLSPARPRAFYAGMKATF